MREIFHNQYFLYPIFSIPNISDMVPDISDTPYFWYLIFLIPDIYYTQYLWYPIYLVPNIYDLWIYSLCLTGALLCSMHLFLISNRLKIYYVSPYIDTNSKVVLIMTVGTNIEVVRLVIFSGPRPSLVVTGPLFFTFIHLNPYLTSYLPL